MLAGKKIIVGITGSIAAYKAAMLVRELMKAGAEVRVVMTQGACEFIAPLTLATLSRQDVVVEMFPRDKSQGVWHIHLGIWADAMIIAPASANTIAKLAYGFADNALTSLVLALRCPLIVAPVMDMDMLNHPATQENIRVLQRRGVTIIEPEEGELASGLLGPGRLPDTELLLERIEAVFPSRDLQNETVLITAGPTYEPIDPARFIGNYSSGKMGFALAEAAAARGATVTLVTGPVKLPTPPGVLRYDVTTAEEMFATVKEKLPSQSIAVMAAAVADFRPAAVAELKMKKQDIEGESFAIPFIKNPDILHYAGENKGERFLVGFALETDNAEANATAKLRSKNADMVVLNNPLEDGAGFATDTNIASLLYKDGSIERLALMAKRALADLIFDRIIAIRSASSS